MSSMQRRNKRHRALNQAHFSGACVLLALSLAYRSAGASESDGNTLLSQCNSALSIVDRYSAGQSVESTPPSTALGAGVCLGLMHGMTTSHSLYRDLGRSAVFCVPMEGVSNGQAARIVVKYLNDHPEKLHMEGYVLATFALRQAFPCEKAGDAARQGQ